MRNESEDPQYDLVERRDFDELEERVARLEALLKAVTARP